MKKLGVTLGIVAIIGSVAMASNAVVSNNSNKKVDNPTTVQGQHCDFLEHLMGMCRSSQELFPEN